MANPHEVASIKRRIFQLCNNHWQRLRPHLLRHAPKTAFQCLHGRQFHIRYIAFAKAQPESLATFIHPPRVVKHHRTAFVMNAGPCPVSERIFQWFCAPIRIVIRVAFPSHIWCIQFDFNTSMRRYRHPLMQSGDVERHRRIITLLQVKFYDASQRSWQRHASLIECDGNNTIMNPQRTWSTDKLFGISPNITLTTLRHGPAVLWSIKRNIHRTKIFRITQALAPRPRIVRRKYTTDKSNDRQAVLSIITLRVEIPPAISTSGNYLVKARSCNSASAARMPESAAIGTPGPGCTLPPAR